MIGEQIDKCALCKIVIDQPVPKQRRANTGNRESAQGQCARCRYRPGDIDAFRAAISVPEMPCIPKTGKRKAQAIKVRKIGRLRDCVNLGQIGRTGTDPITGLVQPGGNYVTNHLRPQANGQIDPVGNQIEVRVRKNEIETDAWKCTVKAREQWNENSFSKGHRCGDPQRSPWPVRQRESLIARGVDFFRNGTKASQENVTGFSEFDPPCSSLKYPET